MGDLVESIKKAALEAVENNDPSCVMYGKVIQASPLQIQVNVKLILQAEQLVLTRNVTDYTVNVSASTGYGGGHKHEDSLGGETTSNGSHSHGITSLKILNALKVGEEVILIRQAGGQEYIVLDRVG